MRSGGVCQWIGVIMERSGIGDRLTNTGAELPYSYDGQGSFPKNIFSEINDRYLATPPCEEFGRVS